MILVYNFLLTFSALLLSPFIGLMVMGRAKYRGRTLERFGFKTAGLKKTLAVKTGTGCRRQMIFPISGH